MPSRAALRFRVRPPAAEGVHEPVARLDVDGLRIEPAGQVDRPPHLIEVGGAAVAHRQVLLEAHLLGLGERPLQVRRHQLYDLAAAQHALRLAHAALPSRYSSSASRTLARPRCRRTRWLTSLMSSRSHTSWDDHPSTSRSEITARCDAGSMSIASCTRSRVSPA